jgi:hypothetical protein
MGHEEQALMPDHDDIPRRRRVLVLDVTQAAAEVSRLTREACDLNLPIEPGSATAATRWFAGRPAGGGAALTREPGQQ